MEVLSVRDIDARVEQRKAELFPYNRVKTEDADSLRDHVFCCCPTCHQQPLLQRLNMRHRSTAHRHKKSCSDRQADGTRQPWWPKTSVSLERYCIYYREFLGGKCNDNGSRNATSLQPNTVQFCTTPSAASLHRQRKPEVDRVAMLGREALRGHARDLHSRKWSREDAAIAAPHLTAR